MPIIKRSSAPTFSLPGLTVVGLASPTRGARETSVWQLCVAPGTEGTPHSVDREEVFVVVAGRARAKIGEEDVELARGDALVVPPGTSFSLSNPYEEDFEAVAALPVGGRAAMPGGEPFIPPWAA